MRLIPPEGAELAEVECAPMRLIKSAELGSGHYDGHNGEYRLHLPCITEVRRQERDIPEVVARTLTDLLGEEWEVSNRGDRIEICSKPLGRYDDELIMTASQHLLDEMVLPRFGDKR